MSFVNPLQLIYLLMTPGSARRYSARSLRQRRLPASQEEAALTSLCCLPRRDADTVTLMQASSPARHLAHPPVQPCAVHEEPAPPGLPGTPARGHAPQQQLSGQAQEPPVHPPQCWQGCAVCSCSGCRRGTVSLGCDCSPAAPSRSARFPCNCLRIGKIQLSTGQCWDAASLWGTNKVSAELSLHGLP